MQTFQDMCYEREFGFGLRHANAMEDNMDTYYVFMVGVDDIGRAVEADSFVEAFEKCFPGYVLSREVSEKESPDIMIQGSNDTKYYSVRFG